MAKTTLISSGGSTACSQQHVVPDFETGVTGHHNVHRPSHRLEVDSLLDAAALDVAEAHAAEQLPPFLGREQVNSMRTSACLECR